MKITITAELTDEQVQIVSSQKWYSETTTELQDWVLVEIPNSATREEFIKSVYESMIKNDAKGVFIAYANQSREEERQQEEQAIQALIDSSITSTIDA